MESFKSGWQELKTVSGPRCPKLFYNFTADRNGYRIQFTDLIGFWTAICPSQDICDYAKITKTSIDPSDSTSQLHMLQQKLCQSLAEGDNTLRQDDEGINAILLQTVLKLPRPLQPLKWEFYLSARGTEELAENILRPCLLEASESKNKLESLEGVIKAKDHVIAKLIDKIDGSSIDLSMIFPGITGARSRKGQTTLKDAQKHVPGLKPFNKDDWRKHFEVDSPYAGFEMVGLSKLVVGIEKCPKHKSYQHEQWLSKLPKATASASQGVKDQMQDPDSSSNEDNSDSDSDQFESQRKGVNRSKRSENERTSITEPVPKKITRRPNKSSPMISSSSIPTPPPLSITQSRGTAPFSSTTSTPEPSDLDDTKMISRARLGQLGGRPKTPVEAPSLTSAVNMSSSPPALRVASPSPELPSSPPTLSIRAQVNCRPQSSSSIATLSSLNPTTPPKRRLGRLGSFRSTSASISVTPEHKRMQDSNGSKEETNLAGNTQGSPSRRLGRIGRAASQLSRQQTGTSPLSEGDESRKLRGCHEEGNEANDSDASTASTASLASPEPSLLQPEAGVPVHPVDTEAANGCLIPHPDLASAVPLLETQKELSKEERAAQRRQELKRKTGATDVNTRAIIGNTSLRKRRKF